MKLQKIKCRVCRKNEADFMDYNICEQCEIKNMKKQNKIGKGINMDIIFDGRRRTGSVVKKVAKILYPVVVIILCLCTAYMLISIFVGITG